MILFVWFNIKKFFESLYLYWNMKNIWNIKWVKIFLVVVDCEEFNVFIFLGKKNSKLCFYKYSFGVKCFY